jgi:Cft2 family RNA processing exonuclease
MQITDLNTARDIGANCLLVETGPFRFLIDCGLHPKKVGLAGLPDLGRLELDELDFIIITHAHLDHGGSLPVLLRNQTQAPILVTPPTQALLPRMLRNSCSVMMKQREELRLKEYPLFTFAEIERLEGRLHAMPYGLPKIIEKNGEKLELTFFLAGHVAGAAGLRVVHGSRRVFFTGDVLFADQITLAGARFPTEKFDTVITETTRGARGRPPESSRVGEAERALNGITQTLAGGGSVLVPVFALGRMQEMVALLHEALRAGNLPRVPIFVSGLGLDLVDYFDRLARKNDSIRFRKNLLLDLGAEPLRQDLVPGREPGTPTLYLVSSGMMVENTPSYAVAATLVGRPKHAIFFVGYCDPETPGGQLLATPREAKFTFTHLHYTTPVRAHVERFDLSAHAEREELLAYAREREPRTVLLTHGDPAARAWFAENLSQGKNPPRVIDPVPGEIVEV